MFPLSRVMQISFQLHTGTHFLSSWAKSNLSSLGPVGCHPGGPLKKKDLKFLSLSGQALERGSLALKSWGRTGKSYAIPDTEGNMYGNAIRVDFSETTENTDGRLNYLSDNGSKCEVRKVEEDARNMAIRFLAARAITVVELRKKLNGKMYPREVIDSVIADLCNRGLVSDELYAESFSRSRWLANTWGPRRIKKALLDKGVSAEDADKAAVQVFKDGKPSGGGQYGVSAMSKLSMDHLLTQASKQWHRNQNKPPEKRKASMVRWLSYRGFDWATIKIILEKLMRMHPP